MKGKCSRTKYSDRIHIDTCGSLHQYGFINLCSFVGLRLNHSQRLINPIGRLIYLFTYLLMRLYLSLCGSTISWPKFSLSHAS